LADGGSDCAGPAGSSGFLGGAEVVDGSHQFAGVGVGPIGEGLRSGWANLGSFAGIDVGQTR